MLVAWLCKGEVIFDLWTSVLFSREAFAPEKSQEKWAIIIGWPYWFHCKWPKRNLKVWPGSKEFVWETKLRTDFIWRNRYIFCHTNVTRIFCLGYLLFHCKSFSGGGSEYEFVTQSPTFCAPGLLFTRKTHVLLSGRICLHFIEKLNHIRSKSRCIYM